MIPRSIDRYARDRGESKDEKRNKAAKNTRWIRRTCTECYTRKYTHACLHLIQGKEGRRKSNSCCLIQRGGKKASVPDFQTLAQQRQQRKLYSFFPSFLPSFLSPSSFPSSFPSSSLSLCARAVVVRKSCTLRGALTSKQLGYTVFSVVSFTTREDERERKRVKEGWGKKKVIHSNTVVEETGGGGESRKKEGNRTKKSFTFFLCYVERECDFFWLRLGEAKQKVPFSFFLEEF